MECVRPFDALQPELSTLRCTHGRRAEEARLRLAWYVQAWACLLGHSKLPTAGLSLFARAQANRHGQGKRAGQLANCGARHYRRGRPSAEANASLAAGADCVDGALMVYDVGGALHRRRRAGPPDAHRGIKLRTRRTSFARLGRPRALRLRLRLRAAGCPRACCAVCARLANTASPALRARCSRAPRAPASRCACAAVSAPLAASRPISRR